MVVREASEVGHSSQAQEEGLQQLWRTSKNARDVVCHAWCPRAEEAEVAGQREEWGKQERERAT